MSYGNLNGQLLHHRARLEVSLGGESAAQQEPTGTLRGGEWNGEALRRKAEIVEVDGDSGCSRVFWSR